MIKCQTEPIGTLPPPGHQPQRGGRRELEHDHELERPPPRPRAPPRRPRSTRRTRTSQPAHSRRRGVLDIRLIRRDPDAVRAALARRGRDAAAGVDRVLELDERWRAITTELEQLRAEQNRASRALKGAPSEEQRAELAALAARGRALSDEESALRAQRDAELAALPNLPADDAPTQDTVLREVGEGAPSGRDHLELAGDMIDMERGARLSGSRFAYLRGRPGAARARAGPLRAGEADRRGVRAGDPAGAGARAGAVRHRVAARHRAADLRAARRRPVPGRAPRRWRWPRCTATRSWPRTSCRCATPGSPPASARGGRRGQGHAGDLPRPPVRQGRDVLLRGARAAPWPSTSGCWRSRSRSCRSSRSPTGW